MPLYCYECRECGNFIDDVEQSIRDEPLRRCPKCEADTLERVIGQTSFVLRGGGWANHGYSTTNRSRK